MTARAAFKQDDVARAVKGAIAGGATVARIEVSPIDGKIVIVTGDGAARLGPAANDWDEDLRDQGSD